MAKPQGTMVKKEIAILLEASQPVP